MNKEDLKRSLDIIAADVIHLVSHAKKIEELNMFSSCLGSLSSYSGVKYSWQLYNSILKIIDVLQLDYTVSVSSPGVSFKVTIYWPFDDTRVEFSEIVSKEDLNAWFSKKRR